MNYTINKNSVEISGVFTDVEEKSLRAMCQNVYLTFAMELSYAYKSCKESGERFSVEDYWENLLVGDIMERAMTDEKSATTVLCEYGLNSAFTEFVAEHGLEAVENGELTEQLTYNLLYNTFHRRVRAMDLWDLAYALAMKTDNGDVFFVEDGKYVGTILN